MRKMLKWHWVSSAICLVAMVFFSVTGITLNHAAEIGAEPAVVNATANVPRNVLEMLGDDEEPAKSLPAKFESWLSQAFANHLTPGALSVGTVEVDEYEVYVSMPGPGRDAWLTVDRETGRAEFEQTERGWIAYFNDLHKGRNTGPAWRWFIDLFAVASLVFCFSGLYLLYFHARQRRSTWPLVAVGVVIPFLLMALAVH